MAGILHRFTSPLVVQLLVIAVVSSAIGEWKSTIIVGAMIVLSLKWNIQNIKRFMACIGPISSLFEYAILALMWLWGFQEAFAE